MFSRLWMGSLSGLVLASVAMGASVTLDMNGFPNLVGGQISGPGMAEPVKFKPEEQKVVFDKLEAGKSYAIDFYHNSGENSSDFTFTMNSQGTGVESVSLGGGAHTMVKDFKPGDSTLKLATFDIVVNANGGETGQYFVTGLDVAYKQPVGETVHKCKAIPGIYNMDNLVNSAMGLEDYSFIVDSKGQVLPGPGRTFNEKGELVSTGQMSDEAFTITSGNAINPRAALVHFHVEAPQPINFHPTHAHSPIIAKETTWDFDMIVPVGAGGVNVWTFGPNTVTKSDALLANGKPLEGADSQNDFIFYPRLRYDKAKATYYFETTKGPAKIVSAEAGGMLDDKTTALTSVKVTATIITANVTRAATQPAPETKPAQATSTPATQAK